VIDSQHHNTRIVDLKNIGVEIPDEDDDAGVLVLAINHRVLNVPSNLSGYLAVSDEDMAAFKTAVVVEGKEISLKDHLRQASGMKHANASFYLSCDRLTLECVEDIAGALAAIHKGPRPAAMHYEVYGESGLVVLRNGGITVAPDDAKKVERNRLKDAIRDRISEMVDASAKVPDNALRDAAKAVKARMKQEDRPYWTGEDLGREAARLIRRGFCAVKAEYPKFLSRLQKDLNGCLASFGRFEPEALAQACRLVNSKLAEARKSERLSR